MKILGKRVRVVYQEIYIDDIFSVSPPTLPHLRPGYIPKLAWIIKSGTLQDGRIFQDIRVVIEANKTTQK